MSLYWKGRPVPWITRWTSEKLDPGPRIGLLNDRIRFEDETPEDRIEGQLWLREGHSPGVGEPMWRDVHSHRQRLAQVEGRCQVCSEVIERPCYWLIPPHLSTRTGDTLLTDVAPLCRSCLEVSLHLCPALLRGGSKLYEVKDWRPYSVYGDTLEADPTGRLLHGKGDVRLDSAGIEQVMARQLVVELWNYRRKPL